MKTFYLAAAVFGTILPWLFFAGFTSEHGPNLLLFVQLLFANGPSSGFTTDLLIACTVFWVWSWQDARQNSVSS